MGWSSKYPSPELTANIAPENGWLEDENDHQGYSPLTFPSGSPSSKVSSTFHVNSQPMAPNDFIEVACQAYQATPEEYRSLRTGAFWRFGRWDLVVSFRKIWMQRFQFPTPTITYPFSHNHGTSPLSMKGNAPVGDTPIFHWTMITPWKTNMSPENHWLEDVFPIEIAPF